MTTTEIKKSVIDSIENADYRLLKMIKDLVENYQEGEIDQQISQRHKDILNDRLIKYRESPNDLLDWEEVKESW